MRHTVFAALLVLYVIVLGQNWGVYTAAILAAVYRLHGGNLTSKL